MGWHTLRTAGTALLLALAGILALHGPLGVIDDQVSAVSYAVRGTMPPDTNIIIVYIDDAAVRVLGWPIKRNFHALMLSALADLKVRTVGIEVMFEDPRAEYPEYDDLLGRMIAAAPPAVLTCYLDSLTESAEAMKDTGDAQATDRRFNFPAVDPPLLSGRALHLPYAVFADAAAGIGHVNLAGKHRIPLFVSAGRATIPAFGLAVVQAFLGTERGGVQSDGDEITLRSEGRKLRWNTERGTIGVNYPGPVGAFAAYPFLEVLRDYDDARRDLPTRIPLSRFRGKIVLIGVAAEGRGAVYDTPVDPRLPSIALHAALVDNLLQSRVMTRAGAGILLLVSLMTGVLCVLGMLYLSPPWDRIGPPAVILLLVVASYFLFAWYAYALPVAGPIVAGLIAVTAAGISRHREVRRQVDALAAEKAAVLATLSDKEARLAMLERQLLDTQADRSAAHTREILEDIRRYKAEIRTLASRADDMEEASPVAEGGVAASFEGIVYSRNGGMHEVVEFVKKIASSDAPVMILGESGTGKELIARALHRLSGRNAMPFVAVNCGALSETLLESELFGHEKGSFTGALKEKAGRFELADRGTIFLDEIAEVSEGFQVKLLRVLQEGELERVGGTMTLKVNVRVLAATNKDLKERITTQQFREDLYYRLNVLTVSIPALRERQEDIPLLVQHFLSREGGDLHVSRNVMEALQNHVWPGNIRELESTIRRGALLAKAEHRSMLTVKDLPKDLAEVALKSAPLHDQALEMIRELGFSRSAVTETAAALGGLNRGTVAEYLRGESLKIFVDQRYDLDRAIRYLSLSTDEAVHERVRKRYLEYLSNIVEGLDRSQPWEVAKLALRSKAKNLPQRYYVYLEQCAEAYFRGVWRLP